MNNVIILGDKWFVPDEDYYNGMRPISEEEKVRLMEDDIF